MRARNLTAAITKVDAGIDHPHRMIQCAPATGRERGGNGGGGSARFVDAPVHDIEKSGITRLAHMIVVPEAEPAHALPVLEIGRASCRERV